STSRRTNPSGRASSRSSISSPAGASSRSSRSSALRISAPDPAATCTFRNRRSSGWAGLAWLRSISSERGVTSWPFPSIAFPAAWGSVRGVRPSLAFQISQQVGELLPLDGLLQPLRHQGLPGGGDLIDLGAKDGVFLAERLAERETGRRFRRDQPREHPSVLG